MYLPKYHEVQLDKIHQWAKGTLLSMFSMRLLMEGRAGTNSSNLPTLHY